LQFGQQILAVFRLKYKVDVRVLPKREYYTLSKDLVIIRNANPYVVHAEWFSW
jgi:hypothetical protein